MNPMADQQHRDREPNRPEKKTPGAAPAGEKREASPTGADKAGAAGPQTGEGAGSASISLKDQLEAALAERDANYNLYLRAQAELANYRKRVQKEAEEMRQYQALPVARDLLPALDNLHRALAAAETSGNVQDLVNGVRLVAKQIEAALGRHEVVPIEAAGKPFDPNLHQAIQQIETREHPPMTVVQEVERGFTLKDRVVRPATVIVSTSPSNGGEKPTKRPEPSRESE
jgi:molecular chaperone GrpE